MFVEQTDQKPTELLTTQSVEGKSNVATSGSVSSFRKLVGRGTEGCFLKEDLALDLMVK